MMAPLDCQKETDTNTDKLDIFLPGVNQILENNQNTTSNMHTDLKSDLKQLLYIMSKCQWEKQRVR